MNREASKPRRGFDFEDLYRHETPRLLRFFLRKLGNRADADDMTQEAMARFLAVEDGHRIDTPQAYLSRIATNLLRDRRERGSTRLANMSLPFDEGLASAGDIDQHRDLAGRAELERWKTILLRLPPRTLEILLLNRVEGRSYREIAEDLRLPLWVIQKHMLKAIRHIAAHQPDRDD